MSSICVVFDPGGSTARPDPIRHARVMASLRERSPEPVAEWSGPGLWLAGSGMAIPPGEEGVPYFLLDGRTEGSDGPEGSDLRLALERLFEEDSPTEAVTRRSLGSIAGEFAACAIDPTGKRVLAVRDRFGTRPLFYAEWSGTLVVASECAVIRALGVPLDLDAKTLRFSLVHRWVGAEACLLRPIKQVPPGTLLLASSTTAPRTIKYWDLDFVPEMERGAGMDHYADQLDQCLRAAVSRLSAAGQRVGLLLSGGVDSSVLAAIGREELPSLTTYVARVPGLDTFEADRAQEVSRILGLDCRVVDIDPTRLPEDVVRLVHRVEELPRHQNTLVLMQILERAREDVEVMMQGDAADTLLGLAVARRAGQFSRKRDILRVLPRPVQRWGAALVQRLHWPWAWRLSSLLAFDTRSYIATQDAIWYSPAVRRSLEISPLSLQTWGLDPVDPDVDLDVLRRRMLLSTFIQSSLVRHDRLSQPLGLRSAVPYLASEVVELARRMPQVFKYREVSKPVLRSLCDRYLPPKVSQWSKGSFQTPWRMWIQEELKVLVDDACRALETIPALPPRFIATARRTGDPEGLWTALSLYLFMENFGFLES